jgi:hypothetical protein
MAKNKKTSPAQRPLVYQRDADGNQTHELDPNRGWTYRKLPTREHKGQPPEGAPAAAMDLGPASVHTPTTQRANPHYAKDSAQGAAVQAFEDSHHAMALAVFAANFPNSFGR